MLTPGGLHAFPPTPQGQPIPRDNKQLATKHTFLTQASQSRSHTASHAFIGRSYPRPLTTPRPGTRQLGTAAMPQSPVNSTLADLKPVYLAPTHGNHNKGSCPHPPTSWPMLVLPCVAPVVWHVPSLKNAE